MLRAPQFLAAQHRLEDFDCGKPALNDWLLRHARQALALDALKHRHLSFTTASCAEKKASKEIFYESAGRTINCA